MGKSKQTFSCINEIKNVTGKKNQCFFFRGGGGCKKIAELSASIKTVFNIVSQCHQAFNMSNTYELISFIKLLQMCYILQMCNLLIFFQYILHASVLIKLSLVDFKLSELNTNLIIQMKIN